jgi:general secretion pathway protein G
MHNRKSENSTQVRRGGFTLLELLIVLGIILAIAAMVVPNLLGRQQEANIKQTKINIANFDQAVKQYAASHNAEFPQGGQADVVQMLMSGESSEGQVIQPYLEAVPKDAWGIPLFYEYPNTKNAGGVDKPAVWSSGPDKQNQDGGGDDITNWSQTGL